MKKGLLLLVALMLFSATVCIARQGTVDDSRPADRWIKIHRSAKDFCSSATSYTLAPTTQTYKSVSTQKGREWIYVVNQSTNDVYMTFISTFPGTSNIFTGIYNNGIILEGNDRTVNTEENKWNNGIYKGPIYFILDPAEQGGIEGKISVSEILNPNRE